MIKITGDMSLCFHPDQVTEIVNVAPQATSRYERTSSAPVKGMLRRRRPAPPAQPFHRATCPDCGSWGASLYWPPVISPTLVNTKNNRPTRAGCSAEKELT